MKLKHVQMATKFFINGELYFKFSRHTENGNPTTKFNCLKNGAGDIHKLCGETEVEINDW